MAAGYFAFCFHWRRRIVINTRLVRMRDDGCHTHSVHQEAMMRRFRQLLALQGLPAVRRMSSRGKDAVPSKICFLGLGNMGSRMAKHLEAIEADGWQLVVHDKSIQAMERLKREQGIDSVDSPEEAASTEGVDVIITMLKHAEDVRRVYLGSNGLLSPAGGVRPSLFIDCSTIDPGTAREVAEAVQGTQLHKDSRPFPNCSSASPMMVDAPVSGGVSGASAATLTFMCGGDRAAVQASEPILKLMGKRVIHCGGAGTGQSAKVCNNLVLAASMAAVAEGLALGQRLGIDPRLLSNIMNSSSAQCWSSESCNPCPGVMHSPASRDYRAGFAVELMVKDIALAQAAAASVDMTTPMLSQSQQLYKRLAEADQSADFSGIYKHVYGGLPAAPEGASTAEEAS